MTTIRCTVQRVLAASILLALGGCALQGPPAAVAASAPAQWQAPLPHNGKLTDLASWWQDQGDSLLVELITDAQQVSPTIAAAGTRIAQARADRVAAAPRWCPRWTRRAAWCAPASNRPCPAAPPRRPRCRRRGKSTCSAANRATRDAAAGALRRRRAPAGTTPASRWPPKWRTSTTPCAPASNCWRCAEQDAVSRRDTARLTELSAGAGFQSPANAALARASAAEGNSRAIAQRAACDVDVKALVALTAMPEAALRQKLRGQPRRACRSPVAIAHVPAQTAGASAPTSSAPNAKWRPPASKSAARRRSAIRA